MSETVFADVLAVWKHGIDVHDPEEVGALFAGGRPVPGRVPRPSRGRAAVVAYYDGQPRACGSTTRSSTRAGRRRGVITGYAAAAFTFATGDRLAGHVTMVLERTGDRWLVGHYHVSLAR